MALWRLPYKIEKRSDVDYLEFEDNWIRLSFSYYDKEELQEGIKRLGSHIYNAKLFLG